MERKKQEKIHGNQLRTHDPLVQLPRVQRGPFRGTNIFKEPSGFQPFLSFKFNFHLLKIKSVHEGNWPFSLIRMPLESPSIYLEVRICSRSEEERDYIDCWIRCGLKCRRNLHFLFIIFIFFFLHMLTPFVSFHLLLYETKVSAGLFSS